MEDVSSGSAPRVKRSYAVLCAGIAVEDFIFRVDRFPAPGTKASAEDFVVTGGGCAANAAVTIARLGGRATFAGPIGDDASSDRILAGLRGEGVAVSGVVRVPNARASVSGILIDAAGERLIATRRDHGLAAARASDPEALVHDADVVLVDNRFPEFVLPICEAARRRGLRVVLDADRPTDLADPLLRLASHAIFSAEALRALAGVDDLGKALHRATGPCRAFLAVTDGANGALWRDAAAIAHMPAFRVDAIDTLAAGDVFHGAFALALAEGEDEITALRFASAAAACKCTRFGGIAGAPTREAVAALLRAHSH